ncbi:Protein of unknown function [Pyronema omphalodes CBS 100304]|uniref:Uncharacterized protein n=1 Tax=Pyronema omphalodes (strain CBS 100304) TaxID=1076935 RepID=U4LPB4_PYROM|nr:Protein of unknown function [Pyronema omphalodes CBS 100304]
MVLTTPPAQAVDAMKNKNGGPLPSRSKSTRSLIHPSLVAD